MKIALLDMAYLKMNRKKKLFVFRIAVGAVVLFTAPSLSSDDIKAQEEAAQDSTIQNKTEDKTGIKISGLIRNDAYYIRVPKNTDDPAEMRYNLFADALETRLILDRTRDDWSFYVDGRMYIYMSEFAAAYRTNLRLSLMRAFMRHYSTIGDFTLGKTYVNFGNSGLFNPFEIDKSIQFTDLQYARQGIYAFEYLLPWQDLSGLKMYVGINDNFNYKNTMWGISPGYHLGKFDLGAVFNHSDENKNITGVYFKGDAFVGVQGSAGAYMDDKLKYDYSEISGGIDYSFFEGKLVTSLLFYYNEIGAAEIDKYKSSPDSFLLAKYYGFLSLVWMIDEFWSIQGNAFMNFIDYSAMLIPGVSMTIANGLNLTLQAIYATAKNKSEFSREYKGDINVLMRVDGKF